MAATAVPATPPAPRTRPPVRRALAAVAGLLALALIVSAAYALVDLTARHTFVERSAYAGVRSLDVHDATGGVVLTPAPAGAPVRVVTHVTEGLSTPRRTAARRSGGGLLLAASCSTVLASECSVSYEIAVPAGTRLLVRSSADDVVATGVASSASIDLESSAGTVVATGLRAPLVRLSSSAGDVHATGVSGARVVADSSAGDVDLDLATPAQSLAARSSAGDVALTVPDAVYAVDATSSAGYVLDAALRKDPSARRTISAASSAGDVRIDVRR